MTATTTTGLRALSLVCVPTIDQDRAIAFYESLGFEKVEVYLPEGQTGIALAPPPPGQPVEPAQTGIILTTSDVDATHAALRATGVAVDAEVSRMGEPVPPMFWFRDPSGHSLMVVEQS